MINQDKLHFEKTVLPNGHILYTQASDLPVTYARIVIPVGNSHANTLNPHCDGGYFHFLEHMCFERSVGYPDKKAYQTLLAETGSSLNACTDAYHTEYMFEAPAETFLTSFPAFLDHIVSPAFNEADIVLQKGIITNERNQRKYFPGYDELSQYVLTKWMNNYYYSREQLFGSDASLDAISQGTLQNIHQFYFNKPISIFMAGTFDTQLIIELLNLLPHTHSNTNLHSHLHTPSWINKEFHEFASSEIDTAIYHLGGVCNVYSAETVWGIEFILQLLTHEEFGTLQTWIRREKGWSYGLEPDLEYDRDRMVWGIKIPVNNLGTVNEIRKEIHDRISASCHDSALIKSTKKRLLLQTCFDYETITSRLDRAVNMLSTTGYIQSEQDYKNWLNTTVNKDYIVDLYLKYFIKEVIGEFAAVPK